MPEFIVRVGTPDGEIVERTVQASSARAAQEELQRQGMHVFEARRGVFAWRDLFPRGKRVISTERFLLFNQELLALVKAGLPIIQSFDIMLERQKDARFREVLAEIREKIKSASRSPTRSRPTATCSRRSTPHRCAPASAPAIWKVCFAAFCAIRRSSSICASAWSAR